MDRVLRAVAVDAAGNVSAVLAASYDLPWTGKTAALRAERVGGHLRRYAAGQRRGDHGGRRHASCAVASVPVGDPSHRRHHRDGAPCRPTCGRPRRSNVSMSTARPRCAAPGCARSTSTRRSPRQVWRALTTTTQTLDEAKVEIDLGTAVKVVDAGGTLKVRLVADNGLPFDLAVDQRGGDGREPVGSRARPGTSFHVSFMPLRHLVDVAVGRTRAGRRGDWGLWSGRARPIEPAPGPSDGATARSAPPRCGPRRRRVRPRPARRRGGRWPAEWWPCSAAAVWSLAAARCRQPRRPGRAGPGRRRRARRRRPVGRPSAARHARHGQRQRPGRRGRAARVRRRHPARGRGREPRLRRDDGSASRRRAARRGARTSSCCPGRSCRPAPRCPGRSSSTCPKDATSADAVLRTSPAPRVDPAGGGRRHSAGRPDRRHGTHDAGHG